MEKFTEYRKLQKKKQRQINAARRSGWGEVVPVTKKVKSKKIYDRKKAQNRKEDFDSEPLVFYGSIIARCG